MLEFDFTTCDITNSLVRLESPHAGGIPDIHLHSPAPPNPDFRLCGPAYTVKMSDNTSDQTAPELATHFLDTAPPNSVIVIDAPAYSKYAVWNRLLTAGAQAKGVAGVVISGRCRDLSDHRVAGFPVFARGHSALGMAPTVRPSAVNVPLTIQPQDGAECTVPFSAITVEPGDWIFADENGVVCVPKDKVDKVVEMARRGKAGEARAMGDIISGRHAEVWARFVVNHSTQN